MTILDPPVPLRSPAYGVAVAGAVLGVLSAVLLAGLGVFGESPSGTRPYQHASQYWFTSSAVPIALACALVLFGVHALHHGQDGRLGRTGLALTTIGLLVLAGVCAASVAVGHDIQGGPTYILGTLATVIGLALFAAGAWRAGLLPRWLLAVWPIIWLIGSFASISASPLLLAALYIVLIASLRPGRTLDPAPAIA